MEKFSLQMMAPQFWRKCL